MNLDEDARRWHADARLPESLRARLRTKPDRPTPAALPRFVLAAVAGIGLGIGYVAVRTIPPHALQKSVVAPTTTLFDTVRATVTIWNRTEASGARYEAILFQDPECLACQNVYAKVFPAGVPKTIPIRLGVCVLPLEEIHPNALAMAIAQQERYLASMARRPEAVTAEAIVHRQQAAARAAGVTELPTLWLRETKTGRLETAVGQNAIITLLRERLGNPSRRGSRSR